MLLSKWYANKLNCLKSAPVIVVFPGLQVTCPLTFPCLASINLISWIPLQDEWSNKSLVPSVPHSVLSLTTNGNVSITYLSSSDLKLYVTSSYNLTLITPLLSDVTSNVSNSLENLIFVFGTIWPLLINLKLNWCLPSVPLVNNANILSTSVLSPSNGVFLVTTNLSWSIFFLKLYAYSLFLYAWIYWLNIL